MTTEDLIARLRDTTALSDPLLTHEAADALEALGRELAAIRATQKPVAYWVPKAEQFCIADKSGRPFAKAWEPLYASPAAKDSGLVADGALLVIKRLLKVHEDRSEIDAAALAKAMLESAIDDASPKLGGV